MFVRLKELNDPHLNLWDEEQNSLYLFLEKDSSAMFTSFEIFSGERIKLFFYH